MARPPASSMEDPPRKCRMLTPRSKPSRLTRMNSSAVPWNHVAIMRPSSCQRARNRSQSPASRHTAQASTRSRIARRSAVAEGSSTTPSYARAMLDTTTIGERDLRDETTALLRDLLRVDTTNPPGRETAAATLLKDYLEASGVECELVARDPDRANLVARIRGTGDAPSLALLGHTDVVPAEPAGWTHPPFSGHLD